MKTFTKKEKKIYYKNFIIQPIGWYYKESKNIFDITYTIYFKDGSFFTNFMNSTLEQVKEDLKNYC